MADIVIQKSENPPDWDNELEQFGGGLFMSGKWLSVISNHERIPLYLKFISNDSLIAMAGGIEMPVGGGQHKQLFFYSGIACKSENEDLARKCKNALLLYARNNGYMRVSLRSYDHQTYITSPVKGFKKSARIEYIFRLDKDTKELANSFSKKIRYRARKAKEKGVVLSSSQDPGLAGTLFSLIGQTYQARQSKGYGHYAYMFLPFMTSNAIQKMIEDKIATFYFSELDGRLLSMNLVFTYDKKAYGILMGTSHEGYKTGSPSFHYFELVKLLKEQGFHYYNLGGVQIDRRQIGLKHFKDKLGADIITSGEEVTNFINPPLIYLNPLLNLKRFMNELKILPWAFKKTVIKITDLVIRNRDRY